jgi:hypothetical protein
MAGTPAPWDQEEKLAAAIHAHDLVVSYLESHPALAEGWRIERYYEILALAERAILRDGEGGAA